MLGGRDFSRRVEKDLVKAFEKNRKPLSELSDSIRQRTLYDIHDKAKTVKKSLSVRGVDELVLRSGYWMQMKMRMITLLLTTRTINSRVHVNLSLMSSNHSLKISSMEYTKTGVIISRKK